MGGVDVLTMPPDLMFDVLYALALEEDKDRIERRQDLDAKLASSSAGRPDRETWGKLPSHQRQMRAALVAGGGSALVDSPGR